MKTKRPVEKGDWRKRQYESSTAFDEARIVVEHDLRQSAKTHRREVETFLTWVREYGKTASTGETRKKIETFPSEVRDSLWLYVDFVLRFRVFLKSIKQNGVPDFVPEYVKPRHSQLKVGFSEGKLVLPKTDPDTDCRDRLASVGGVPAQIRRGVKAKRARILMPEQNEAANLAMQTRGVSEEELDYLRAVQRLRGSNPEDAKLRIVEVHARDKSALTRLMDHAYDPLAATLLLVRSRRQTRLLWLEGELLNDDEWKQLDPSGGDAQTHAWQNHRRCPVRSSPVCARLRAHSSRRKDFKRVGERGDSRASERYPARTTGKATSARQVASGPSSETDGKLKRTDLFSPEFCRRICPV